MSPTFCVAAGLASWAPAAYLASISSRLHPPSPEYLALVAENTRHSPGTVGARLLVAENGETVGTIGGGVMERDLIARAAVPLRDGGFLCELQTLHHRRAGEGERSGMICAGSQFIDVYRNVIWGFTDIHSDDESTIVDATAFLLRDSHGVATRLALLKEGKFSVDASRSAIYMPRTRAFPDNTEIEAIVTFIGEPSGKYLPTVVPDRNALTVHMHHSFIRLPDDDYEPLPYDPRSGVSKDLGPRENLSTFSYHPPDERDWVVLLQRSG